MPFLIAAVVLVGALCLFDLLLTFAVLRRLREHTAELERLAGRPGFSSYDPGMLVGHRLPEAARAHGATLVAFFDAQCDTCHDHAPKFAARARRHSALAVVSGDGARAGELIGAVGPDAMVMRGDDAHAVADDLGIQAFPTFVLVDPDGSVVQATTELAELPEPAPAA
ncbi:TlpA family protein disulfide reductase [Streptomyces sp. NPDC013953]|uniref:TlpA family protein disulfide reductase n=1 Tax=Streptomyces sp. NPDC013953 TaxID=3364868 RepID=UPI0036FAAA0C